MSEQPTTVAPAAGPEIRICEHPAAARSIRRIRGWGGVLGFALVALLSWRAGLPGADLLGRALVGGIVAHLLAWVCAVAVWRRLVIAELEIARRRLQQAVERAQAEAEAAGAAS